VTRRHQKLRRILVEEAGGRCVVCGYDRCAFNLHFHHVYPAEKAFEMSTAAGKALDTYREEAKKCVLVCANCHGEIETGVVASPPPGARYGETWESVPPAKRGAEERPTDTTPLKHSSEQLAFEVPPS
jgi:hypothetical protein